jgi:hypothetical protein
MGNVNCNMTVDAIDASLVLQYSAGLVPTLECLVDGHTNHDLTINAIDASLILQLAAGLVDPFRPLPPCLCI